jgi:predicted nucleotidyltransferase
MNIENVKVITADLKQSLKLIYGDKLKNLILFGSYARGDAHKNSDIDLLAIIESKAAPFNACEEIDRMNDAIYEMVLKYDVALSVIPVSEHQYMNSPNPLFVNIKNEGIAA